MRKRCKNAIIFPDAEWEIVAPQAAGFDRQGVQAFKRWLDENAAVSPYRLVVIRNGYLVIEWSQGFERDARLGLASAGKSILSSLLGIAIAEGKIGSADDRVLDYFPQAMNVPPGFGPKAGRHVFDKDRAITFRQLISNTSGYMKPGEEPGKVFHYQTFGMNILAHAIATCYGLYDVADPTGSPGIKRLIDGKIALPLQANWDYAWMNFDHPSTALTHIFGYFTNVLSTARDMARLGWLWCNHGYWHDRTIIPSAWLQEATRTSPDIHANCPPEQWQYGYGFWVNDHRQLFPQLPPDCFLASGAGNQFIWVYPGKQVVIVLSPGLWSRRSHNPNFERVFGDLLACIDD